MTAERLPHDAAFAHPAILDHPQYGGLLRTVVMLEILDGFEAHLGGYSQWTRIKLAQVRDDLVNEALEELKRLKGPPEQTPFPH